MTTPRPSNDRAHFHHSHGCEPRWDHDGTTTEGDPLQKFHAATQFRSWNCVRAPNHRHHADGVIPTTAGVFMHDPGDPMTQLIPASAQPSAAATANPTTDLKFVPSEMRVMIPHNLGGFKRLSDTLSVTSAPPLPTAADVAAPISNPCAQIGAALFSNSMRS